MLNRIANYEIKDRLGEGGMGEVFRGRDVMLEREVAIKALRPELATHPDVVERFRTEAVALAKLHHPNIAAVYNFIRENERCYIVMEYVDGQSLEAILRQRGALPWTEAIAIARQALEGLEHAHRSGIVHRDVKPANIMLARDGTVKLMDFGIARILETARLTREGHLVGTLEYMSPEQVLGQDVDARADLYAMGIVLYQALTGVLPFPSSSDYDMIRAQVERQPAPPRTLCAEIPAALDAVLLRALAKAREERFQSASELSEALAAVAAETGSASPSRPPPPTRLVTLPSVPPVEAPPARASVPGRWAGVALLVLMGGGAITGAIAYTVRSLHPLPQAQDGGPASAEPEAARPPEPEQPPAPVDTSPPPAPSAEETPVESALPATPAAAPPAARATASPARPATPASVPHPSPAPVPTTARTPAYAPVCRAQCADTARACKSSCKVQFRGHDRHDCAASCEAVERDCKGRAPC
jgi:serine/threonine-protein kinase